MDRLYESYVEHLKRSLTGLLDRDEFVPVPAESRLKRSVRDAFSRRGLVIGRIVPIDEQARMEGRTFPPTAATMIGTLRLENLQTCIEDILRREIPGDIIETGVWRGGASIFMKAILEAHGDTRSVWLADSFEGLPPPSPEKYPTDANLDLSGDEMFKVSMEAVRDNFRRYGLLDDRVRFVKGWFRDTLPGLGDRTWSLVRLDGDLYESTMDGLTNLYPGLSHGGYVVVDDYGALVECRTAVDDFRAEHGITEPIVKIDWTGVYWQKLS